MATLPPTDGPPPYIFYGEARFQSWRVAGHPDWLEWEVWLWLSLLCWDPWQHPSVQTEAPGSTHDEARSAVVPNTRVGITYVVAPKARAIRLIEVADLP